MVLLSKFRELGLEVLGPAPCPIERINNYFRYHILIKSKTHSEMIKLVRFLYKQYKAFESCDKIRAEIDIDPTQIL